MGWPINWAAYASKVCSRAAGDKRERGVPVFETYVERRRRLPKGGRASRDHREEGEGRLDN